MKDTVLIFWATLAKITSMINCAFPVPLVLNAIKTKSTSQLSPVRYSMYAIMNFSWHMYALDINNDTMWFTTIVGGLIFTVYSGIAFHLEQKYQSFILLIIIIFLDINFVGMLSDGFAGFLCSVTQSIAALTPIEIIMKAWNTKDSSCLNKMAIMLNIPCVFVWSIYAMELRNIVLFIPNFIEFTLVSVQAYFLFLYPSKPKENFEYEPVTRKQEYGSIQDKFNQQDLEYVKQQIVEIDPLKQSEQDVETPKPEDNQSENASTQNEQQPQFDIESRLI